MKKLDQRGALGILEVILLVAILVVAGFVGYRIYQTNTESEPAAVEQDDGAYSDDSDSVSTEPEPTQTQFTAEIGKFTVTIPDEYIIIRQLDGNFEGGPSTAIEIAAKASEYGTNVYSQPPVEPVSLEALPGDSWQSFDEYIDSSLGQSLDIKSGDDVVVDGVTAQVRYTDGLFATTSIFWEKNGLFYRLTSMSNLDIPQEMQVVIDGFSFNQ